MPEQPKRIFAFDGGGIRGIFSLQVAARIEHLFRQAHGRPDLVLSDVVGMFAGTSTGAIIAAYLAWGTPVAEVERLYIRHGKQMFARERWWRRLKSKYRAAAIADFFRQQFSENDGTPALLSSAKLKSLLMVVMRNATTGSPWPISSNPHAIYNDLSRADSNLKLPLWQLLRASTAAPSFFPPEEITLGKQKFLFVDGGVTPYNNPALIALLMATLPCYHLNWPIGVDALHLTSIGTGGQRSHFLKALADKIYLWDHIRFVIPGLIGAISDNQDTLCRVLGKCVHGAPLDSELQCLDAPSLLPDAEQKFTYARYNCRMDSAEIGHPLTTAELMLDNLAVIERLQQIGRDYAAQHVLPEHFGL
jgi:hypothetical protein